MTRVRIAVSLLALVFAVTALAPCAFARAGELGRQGDVVSTLESLHSDARARTGHHALAHPCHDSVRASLKAPCPCGCGERAAGPALGALGVALLLAPLALPAPSRTRGRFLSRARFALAPPRVIEKVPRSA
jgi:hypothetical protein